jgi:hypothetical protein
MIFFDSSNAPNAPNDILKTTLFFLTLEKKL